MRRLAAALSAVLAAAAAVAKAPVVLPSLPMPADARWCLMPMQATVVPFRGVDPGAPVHDGPGNAMIYPAFDVVSLLAAIATHAAIASGIQSKQERDRLQLADQVLEPYRPVLEGFSTEDLARLVINEPDGASLALCGAIDAQDEWTVEMLAAFAMSQDQRNLQVDAQVQMHPPGATTGPARLAVVRVVSNSLEGEDPFLAWTGDGGKLLKQQSAAIAREALETAVNLGGRDPVVEPAAWKTYRFQAGGVERIERAQRVGGNCQRAVLKTLRGSYLVVTMADSSCPAEGLAPDMPATSPGVASSPATTEGAAQEPQGQ